MVTIQISANPFTLTNRNNIRENFLQMNDRICQHEIYRWHILTAEFLHKTFLFALCIKCQSEYCLIQISEWITFYWLVFLVLKV